MNYMELASNKYTALYLKPVKKGIALVAFGEDETWYWPKYCPECGRRVLDEHGEEA